MRRSSSPLCIGDHILLWLAFRFILQPQSHIVTRKDCRARPSVPGTGQDRLQSGVHPVLGERRTDQMLGNTGPMDFNLPSISSQGRKFSIPLILGKIRTRVPNSPTSQVLKEGAGWPVLVDIDDWTQLTRLVRSGLGRSQTSLNQKSHESRNGTQANTLCIEDQLQQDLKASCHIINQQPLNTS